MKIMFVSLGCDKNLVDTENMLGILRNRGFEFTDDEYEADVIAVNTCCFIHDAKQESIDTILEMAEHKKDGKCKALIVSGCLAHRYHDEIEKEIPEVDALLGTASYDKIAEVVLSVLEGKGYSCIDDADRLVMTNDERIITTGGYYEYLKIAEGCDLISIAHTALFQRCVAITGAIQWNILLSRLNNLLKKALRNSYLSHRRQRFMVLTFMVKKCLQSL